MNEHTLQAPEHMAPLLKALREQRGLSQVELARLLGVTPPVLSRLESDASKASLQRLMRVLALLDMELVIRPRGSHTGTHVRESGW